MKRLIFIFLMFSFSNLLFSQQSNSFSSKMYKSNKTTSIDTLENFKWTFGVSRTVNENRGDIQEKSIMNTNNIDYGINLSLSRKLFKKHAISLDIHRAKVYGNQLDTISNEVLEVHDPYRLYEKNGVVFTADILEVNITSNIDLEAITKIDLDVLLNKYYPKYIYNNRLDFYFDLGVGMASFATINRNLISNNYIYAYGYQDKEGKPEEIKSILQRPRAGSLTYGCTFKYRAKSDLVYRFSWLEKLIDTDFLDGIYNSSKRDKYRSISFGIEYLF